MVDLVITAANVVAGEDVSRKSGTAGETVAAGKVGFLSSTTKKWMLADSNSATAEARKAAGIFLNGASLNQPVDVVTKGPVTIGTTLVPGTAYFLSDTPGGICVLADVGSGEYICQLGLAISTTVLDLDIQFPNVAL